MEVENHEVRLVVEQFLSTSSVIHQCRICHEEEESTSSSMESPCSCSGSLKFAHRECIQRWCDEKGSTLCEICLQNFEPGYTVPEKKALIEVPVTIRGSLEVPRMNYEPPNQGSSAIAVDDDTDLTECSAATDRGVSCCRSVAVTFTMLLLLRHFIAVLSVGADQYAFTLVTVFILRASGILVPFYVVMRVLKAVQVAQRQHHVTDGATVHQGIDEEDEEQEDLQEEHHHTVVIQA